MRNNLFYNIYHLNGIININNYKCINEVIAFIYNEIQIHKD